MDVDVVCRYYEPVKAPFVHETMVPAVRLARSSGAHAHLERHWLHGPHVTVAIRGAADVVPTAAERVRALVLDGVARRPSCSRLTVADILDAGAVNGRAELIPGPYEPIHPDNSVQVEAADRSVLTELLGGRPAVQTRADLLAAALDVIDESTGSVPPTSSARVRMTARAMAAHAAQYGGPGVAAGYMSFASHLEDFLFRSDPTGDVRAAFDDVWQRQRDTVRRDVAEAVRIGTGEATTPEPLAQAWARWSTTALALARDAYARGAVPLVPGPGYQAKAAEFADPDVTERWADGPRQRMSAFHTALKDVFDVSAVADAFGPYRFATNVLYQVLLLCDVTPLERYLAASLVSHAVAELTGNDWRALVPAAAEVTR